jgi:hypothetical protein
MRVQVKKKKQNTHEQNKKGNLYNLNNNTKNKISKNATFIQFYLPYYYAIHFRFQIMQHSIQGKVKVKAILSFP